jgi:hypothetical protein
MRYEAFLYQDILRLQVPISLVRSVVIVQTHGKLNKDEQNLLNGHHFLVNLVRKTLMRQLLVRRVVIRFMSINGLLKCIMTPRLFFFFDQPLALPPHLPLQLLSWLVRIVGRCKTLPAAIGRNWWRIVLWRVILIARASAIGFWSYAAIFRHLFGFFFLSDLRVIISMTVCVGRIFRLWDLWQIHIIFAL